MALPKEGEQKSYDHNSRHHVSVHSIKELNNAIDVRWVTFGAAETASAIPNILESLQFSICGRIVVTRICAKFERDALECVVFEWLKLIAHQ